ncbi:N-6 DNA methylase [Micromonospora craniellae]|uniref:site-specific DNA-methyltransferase (adenine-specific) n=1 Tax=Micromonospora craniellae TaxID=2294034 RepID=A0A372FVV0_9ACTN|nr:class I SAM-dependent methyltransferase [Micromonospora craniellae]QOC94064.1 class I SAM-dependent methyltransferase [Micromonospora craniellae]RFS44754.1 class I SAM-dependent methyltransferase [Micromonospora craniellae]
MPRFPGKTQPDADKLRGGYYTPDSLARAVATWVAEAGPRLLEPSCGDGQILRQLVREAGPEQVLGVELLPEEAEAARKCGASVITSDFFTWFTPSDYGSFDGAAGNPPFIRFGNWREAEREPALDLMREQGLPTSRLTNAWLPFVVASLVAVRQGGRIGLVLPAELLQVGYAAPLRSYLVDSCSEISIVAFRTLVFPGILQEVVLLLAERGSGPAVIRTLELDNAADLQRLDLSAAPAVRAGLHDGEKWTKYFLLPEQVDAIRALRADSRMSTLGRWASVDVGVVTGRNSFFTMTPDEAEQRDLADLTVALVSRSQQLTGVRVTEADIESLRGTAARTRLLSVPADVTPQTHTGLRAHVADGELHEVHLGYKCRIRRDWWRVPSVSVPDGFLLRQIHLYPRLVANEAGATSTDTVHRVRVRGNSTTAAQLSVAALNSATFAATEVVGRSYGGGLLELEPTEAELLPIPDPTLVSTALVEKVDELLRESRIEEAVHLVDQQLLIEGLQFTSEEVTRLREAWARLRDRRAARGRSTRSK